MRVAVDAMGGDYAPGEIVAGCRLALQEDPDLQIALVGQKDRIGEALSSKFGRRLDEFQPRISVHHAEHVVTARDTMRVVLKKKQDNSVIQSVILVKEGRIKGVRRPGIGVPLPSRHGVCMTIDLGTNISCKSTHLYQYAVMASLYSQYVLGIENPRVGLVNVGVERSKGPYRVREAHKLLKKADLNYIGFIEGHDMFVSDCDVAVCDGFAGNVLLKGIEGYSAAVIHLLFAELECQLGEMDEERRAEIFGKLKKMTDWTAYGGAPMLGVDGVCVVAHGKSKAVAVASAIKSASAFAAHNINNLILEKLA
jgi:glycerol-3-phosphate acyltransferase PlsX